MGGFCKGLKQLFPLSGEIHIDGTYVHSAPRPKNKKNERVDRRLKENANPNKRSILVMRSRYSEEETAENPYLVGAKKTLTFPILSENSQVVNKLATSYIKAGSRIHADENSAYDELMIHYDLRRVNHQKEWGCTRLADMLPSKHEDNTLQIKEKSTERTAPLFCTPSYRPFCRRYFGYSSQFGSPVLPQNPHSHQPLSGLGCR